MVNDLRFRFPDVESVGARPVRVDTENEQKETQVASVDLIAEQLKAAGASGDAEKRILHAFLGFDDVNQPGATAWPSQTETATQLGVTRAHVSQVIVRARERWRKSPSVTALREIKERGEATGVCGTDRARDIRRAAMRNRDRRRARQAAGGSGQSSDLSRGAERRCLWPAMAFSHSAAIVPLSSAARP